MILDELYESPQSCPECGGPAFSDLILAEKKDACYNKVRSRYKVWPSAYASGALVQCRKKGAANWGNKSKNEDVAESQLEEITRRDLLKGVGAAAVAGAAGGAKAQEVKFDVAARIAVQKAQTAIGKFFWVRMGGEQSRIMDHVAQNVNKAVLAYCMDTNGHNVLEVIDYATDSAYRAADAVPPSITDRGGAKTAISTANTFMDAYTAAILQKLNEYTKASRPQQQQSRPQQQQTQQQRSGARDIFTPEYANLNLALSLYMVSKNSNPEIHAQALQALNQYIQNNNNKEFVNDAYRAIVNAIESARKRDPEVQARREDSFMKAHRSIIDNLNKSTQNTQTDEFKESVEHSIAEDQLDEKCWDTHRQAGMKKKGDRMVPNCVPREGVAEGVDDTVEFEVDTEDAYNLVMDKFGSVINWNGDALVIPRKYWNDVQQTAYEAGGEAKEYGDFGEGVAEGEKVGHMGADKFDAAMARLKQLAGAGPLKTVWDPEKRVYKTVPVNPQPK